MNGEQDPSRTPTGRRGWTWTVIKCALTTMVCAGAGTAALLWALRALLGHLPGWLPAPWAHWAFTWLLRHVWFLGPLAGIVLGLVLSAGIVVFDAKRGRLTKLP